jgi:hypothetical protein
MGADRRHRFPEHMKSVQAMLGGGGSGSVKQFTFGAGVESERVRVLRKRGENTETLGRRIALDDYFPRIRNLDFAGHRGETCLKIAKPMVVSTSPILTAEQDLRNIFNDQRTCKGRAAARLAADRIPAPPVAD